MIIVKSKVGSAVVTIATFAVLATVAGCTSAADTSGAPGASSDSFYSSFEAPTIAPEAGVDEKVDTARFKQPDMSKPVIGYADASLGNSFRVMAKADIEYGVSQVPGASLVYTNANDSAAKQIADVDDMITKGVDAIILAATDVKALCPSIAKAVGAGIPVIIQERKVDCDNYTTFASLNVGENGAYHMEYIAQRLGGKGEIAIISGIPGVGHTVAIEQAYADVLKRYPDIEVVATEYAEYDPTKARDATSAILTAHPDVQAFASISGNLTTGVFQAVQDAGKLDQIKAWTGDDANGWMLTQEKYNLPSMTVPYPTKVGRVTVELAVKILRGETVSKTFEVPKWSDPVEFSQNIADYANSDFPDEWWYTDLPCAHDPFCK